MRTDQLSEEQRSTRSLIMETLTEAGWANDHGSQFDAPDFDPVFDAAMVRQNDHLLIRVYYRADTEDVLVFFSGVLEDYAQLKLACRDSLEAVLSTLVSIQDTASPDTLIENLRAIVRVCRETYAAAGPTGELRQLVLEDDEERE